MFADVTFYTDTQSDVVIVPTEAIRQEWMDNMFTPLTATTSLTGIPVETGLVGDGETEITSGLSGGETLVTVGQFYLSEGAAVRVVALRWHHENCCLFALSTRSLPFWLLSLLLSSGSSSIPI